MFYISDEYAKRLSGPQKIWFESNDIRQKKMKSLGMHALLGVGQGA